MLCVCTLLYTTSYQVSLLLSLALSLSVHLHSLRRLSVHPGLSPFWGPEEEQRRVLSGSSISQHEFCYAYVLYVRGHWVLLLMGWKLLFLFLIGWEVWGTCLECVFMRPVCSPLSMVLSLRNRSSCSDCVLDLYFTLLCPFLHPAPCMCAWSASAPYMPVWCMFEVFVWFYVWSICLSFDSLVSLSFPLFVSLWAVSTELVSTLTCTYSSYIPALFIFFLCNGM